MQDIGPLDLNEQHKRNLNFKFSQFGINTLLGSFTVVSQTLLLYPLQRAQIVRQIQDTYSSQTLKFCKNVFTRCSHYGIRSIFRGLKISIIKNSMFYSIYQFLNKFEYKQNKLAQSIMKGLVATSGYILVYPLQNIKIRMGADLQQERYYSNVRDCIKKIKKHEGTRAFYKGFTVGALTTTIQYFLIQTLIKQKQKYSEHFQNPFMFLTLFLTSFIAYQTLIYPLDTIKKTLQINGSLGHQEYNKKLSNVFKNLTLTSYYRGLPIRIANSSLYVVISLIFGQIGRQNRN